MSIIEKQTELGKSLYEINTSTMKEFFNLQRGNIERYIEVNREFGSKLPEIKDLSTAIELQREYGQTLWNDAKTALDAQGDLLKGAFTNTKEALKVAYTTEDTTVVAEAKETIAESAPKAKKKAKKTADQA